MVSLLSVAVVHLGTATDAVQRDDGEALALVFELPLGLAGALVVELCSRFAIYICNIEMIN